MSSEFHNGRRRRRHRRRLCWLIKIASYVYYTIAGAKQTRLGLAGLSGQHRVAREFNEGCRAPPPGGFPVLCVEGQDARRAEGEDELN